MKVLLQRFDSGAAELADAPVPSVGSRTIVVETRNTLVSTGTERSIVEFGRSNLLEKARAQPDKVRQVLGKVRTDGLVPTMEAVRAKLSSPVALGYCHSGVVVEVGSSSSPFAVGDRVATNGNHAEYVSVPFTLAARIPDNVSFEAASFTALASIGLQGVRLANPTLGETVVVYGLGLVGLLTVQILRATGCRVIGVDTSESRLEMARGFGAIAIDGSAENLVHQVLAATGGVGADAVLLTLASSSNDPIHLSAEMSRKRGRIVLVGVTGLELNRDDFYRKELSFVVSCSYGPGRYDPIYEDRALDYPLPFVRWTEQRNFEAVLQLMADGRLDTRSLISHRFALEDATKAYDLITSPEPSLGVVLTYPGRDGAPVAAEQRTITIAGAKSSRGSFTVGVIGAGDFGSRTLIPAIVAAGGNLRIIASGRGTSATLAAKKWGFAAASTDVDSIFGDTEVDTVAVLTRHDSHARYVVRALNAGKNVFVEKPLALSEAELDEVVAAAEKSGRIVTIGFNRRFAPLAQRLRKDLMARVGPVSLICTVNAGSIPREHWVHDAAIGGGRIVGEACHFIDLVRYLSGSRIVAAHTVPALGPRRDVIDDISHILLTFADGSTAAVHYLANGNPKYPKERIEAFADGRVWQIDNWKQMHAWGARSESGSVISGADKGHRAELRALADAVKNGGTPPIPHDELFEVSRWSIRIAEQARRRPAG